VTRPVTIRPAQPELLDLAAAMRPDWDRDRLSGALAAAANNGWPWPRDLLAEIRDPLHREGRPLSAEDNARHAAEAKAALDDSLRRPA